MGVTQRRYFCLFQLYILVINYRCLEDLYIRFSFLLLLQMKLSAEPPSRLGFLFMVKRSGANSHWASRDPLSYFSLIPNSLVILVQAIHKWLLPAPIEPLLRLLLFLVIMMCSWVLEVAILAEISLIIYIPHWLHLEFKLSEMMKNLRKEEILHLISWEL